jgi:hypothetical protein
MAGRNRPSNPTLKVWPHFIQRARFSFSRDVNRAESAYCRNHSNRRYRHRRMGRFHRVRTIQADSVALLKNPVPRQPANGRHFAAHSLFCPGGGQIVSERHAIAISPPSPGDLFPGELRHCVTLVSEAAHVDCIAH